MVQFGEADGCGREGPLGAWVVAFGSGCVLMEGCTYIFVKIDAEGLSARLEPEYMYGRVEVVHQPSSEIAAAALSTVGPRRTGGLGDGDAC